MLDRRTGWLVACLGALALGVALLLAWRARGESRRVEHAPAAEHAADRPAAMASAPAAGEPDDVRTAAEALHELGAAASLDGGELGALLVSVVRERDGAPLEGVGLALGHAQADVSYGLPEAVTDARGLARFADVPAGTVTVYPDRLPSVRGEVRAGEETRLEITAADGLALAGVVRDADGAPVGCADVWLSESANGSRGRIVATSGGDGRFTVPAVTGDRYLGAYHAHFAPSTLVHLEPWRREGPTFELELVLDAPGGTLEGVVRGPDGAPVPRALVVVGAPRSGSRPVRTAGGFTSVRSAAAQRLFTDAEGRYVARGVAAGPTPVAVRAPGLPPVTTSASVDAPGTTRLDVDLPLGATLVGRIADGADAPLADVTVHLGSYGAPDALHAVTDADGRYRLDGVPPGPIAPRAFRHGVGRAEAELVASAGAELEWSPVFAAGRVLRGRVERAGAPAADLTSVVVTARSMEAESRWRGRFETASDGAFEIRQCPAGPLVVCAYAPEDSWDRTCESFVEAQGDALVLRLPERAPAALEGVLVDATGAPAGGARLLFQREHERELTTAIARFEDGRFRLGPTRPGRGRLVAEGVERAWRAPLGEIELAAGETLELGRLRVPGEGTLAVELVPERTAAEPSAGHAAAAVLDLERIVVEIALPSGQRWTTLPGAGAELVREGPLPAGRWLARSRGPGVALAAVEVEIVEGERTRVALPVRAGRTVRLVVDDAARVAADGVGVCVRALDGTVLARTRLDERERDAFAHELALAPGDYELEVTTAAGLRLVEPLAVTPDAAVTHTVTLPPRVARD